MLCTIQYNKKSKNARKYKAKQTKKKNNKYQKSTKCMSPTKISDLTDGYRTFI